jgi:outer membrane immunogenic protein
MKKLMLAGVSALALAAVVPANAADMPLKARPMAPAPVFSWTGCYVGAHVGYGWGKKDWSGTSGLGWLDSSFNVDGWLGGGQLGCNYQFPASNWMIGIEGSIAAADIKGTGIDGYGYGYVDDAKITSLGSVTGRLGWNGWNPQQLFYVKGGWAWARDAYDSHSGSSHYYFAQNRSGWTLGGGWEWAFAPKWSTFLEYDYYDFGTKTGETGGSLTDIKQTVHTVKIGVNYHFLP